MRRNTTLSCWHPGKEHRSKTVLQEEALEDSWILSCSSCTNLDARSESRFGQLCQVGPDDCRPEERAEVREELSVARCLVAEAALALGQVSQVPS